MSKNKKPRPNPFDQFSFEEREDGWWILGGDPDDPFIDEHRGPFKTRAAAAAMTWWFVL